MKILLLVSSIAIGGAERVASTLANAWAIRGDNVILMPTYFEHCASFYELSSQIRLINLVELIKSPDCKRFFQVKRLLSLRAFILAEQPDVIISLLSNVNVVAIIASIGLNIPVIVCEHTDPFAAPIGPLHLLACTLSYPFASVLLVLTTGIAKKYAAHRVLLPKIHVLANPIPKEIDYVVNQGYDEKTMMRVLGVGRLDDGKQFSLLIRVFSKLAKRHQNWSLRIVGDGKLRACLQKKISSMGLDSRIELPGESVNIAEEYAQADVFALTSKYEGFPMVLLEAMAAGLPCVCFDCPSGPREITMDGQIGLLIPLNDEQAFEFSLEQLMLNSDFRKSLGMQARASVTERYSIHSILCQWNLLFQELGVNL